VPDGVSETTGLDIVLIGKPALVKSSTCEPRF
jgi:hypothetical protein